MAKKRTTKTKPSNPFEKKIRFTVYLTINTAPATGYLNTKKVEALGGGKGGGG